MTEMTELKEIVKNAYSMVSRLCLGEQEWIMSIPVDEERDPDVVIAKALRLADDLLKQNAALVGALEAYINEAEWVSTEFGDGYLAGGLTYENVKAALALVEGKDSEEK